MFKKKFQFQEDNKKSEKDNDSTTKNNLKKELNNQQNKKDLIDNASKIGEEIINPIRGRQPNNNIFTINKSLINKNVCSPRNYERQKRDDNKSINLL